MVNNMKIKKVLFLSFFLALVTVAGLLPGQVAHAYSEGEIAGTTGSGASESDPIIVDTFAEFKAAMENTEIKFVKLVGVNEQIPSQSVFNAALQQSTNKTLIIEGTNIFGAPLNGNNACLIWSTGDLVVKGSGTLKYEHGNSGGHGAVIYQNYGTLKIQGGVTLEGYANGATFGRALYIDGGTTVIDNGIFMGYYAKPANPAPGIEAVIVNEGNVTINGGTFSSTKYSSVPNAVKTYGLRVENGTVKLRGGTYNGIDVYNSSLTGISELLDAGRVYKKSDNSVFNGTTVKETQEKLTVAQVLDTINLTISAPEAGKTPNDMTAKADGGLSVNGQWWYPQHNADGGSMSGTDVFAYGNNYSSGYNIVIPTSLGKTFATTVNVTATNGTVYNVNRVNDTTVQVIVNHATLAQVPIDTINLTISAPEAGKTPNDMTASVDGRLSVNGQWWYPQHNALGGSMSGTDVFAYGNNYSSGYKIVIPTSLGKTFATTVNVTATNGTVYNVNRVNDTTVEVIVNHATLAVTTAFAFTKQPQSGTAKKTESYTFSWTLSDVADSIRIQSYNSLGNSWSNVANADGLSSSSVSYDSLRGFRATYRIRAKKGSEIIYSEPFTVTWTSDSTPTAPTITTSVLPGGKVGTTYNQILAATGDATITWSLDSGNLPTGLTLGTDGKISGTPTTAGTYNFAVKATNDAGSDTKSLTVTIGPADVVTYTVTFKDGDTALSTATVNDGGKVAKPADPIKEGFTFDGWYADAECNVAFDFNQVITANTTIYAKFVYVTTTPPAGNELDAVSPTKPGVSVENAEKYITGLTNDNDPAGSDYQTLQAKASKVTKSSVKLSWKRVSGAKGYIIYGNKCGKKNKYKKIKTVTNTSYTQKKLKKGTYYKYLIVAYDKDNKVLTTSKTIHAATTGGKYDNAKSVTTKAKKDKVTVKVNKTFNLKAKAVAGSKKGKMEKHRAIQYESTDTNIATVSAKGVITGKAKGTCYVYVYAMNGVSKKIKVTVK